MKTKEIVRLTISYIDEFTFDDLRDAMLFLSLWKKGKGDTEVKATVELVGVPTAIDDRVTVEKFEEEQVKDISKKAEED